YSSAITITLPPPLPTPLITSAITRTCINKNSGWEITPVPPHDRCDQFAAHEERHEATNRAAVSAANQIGEAAGKSGHDLLPAALQPRRRNSERIESRKSNAVSL